MNLRLRPFRRTFSKDETLKYILQANKKLKAAKKKLEGGDDSIIGDVEELNSSTTYAISLSFKKEYVPKDTMDALKRVRDKHMKLTNGAKRTGDGVKDALALTDYQLEILTHIIKAYQAD